MSKCQGARRSVDTPYRLPAIGLSPSRFENSCIGARGLSHWRLIRWISAYVLSSVVFCLSSSEAMKICVQDVCVLKTDDEGARINRSFAD